MFSDDLECQKLLMEAMKYHLLPERRPMFQSPRTKPRKSTVGALYAVGGMDATKGEPVVLNNICEYCKENCVMFFLQWPIQLIWFSKSNEANITKV